MNSLWRCWPIFMVIVVFGCKSRKKFAAPKVEVKSDSASNEGKYAADKLLNSTLEPWTYFSSKATIEYINGEEDQNVGSSIRMYKDSLIWVSVNIFGIEGARILINKDSMVIYDKLHKNYRVYHKELIESVLGAPLTVGEIQNIILAKPVYSLKLYDIIKDNDHYLKIKNQQPGVFVNHTYQKQFFTIDTTLIEDRTNPHYARINYFNFANVNEHNFPLKNEINAYNGASLIQIKMEFENPDFINSVTFPFTIPASYERIK